MARVRVILSAGVFALWTAGAAAQDRVAFHGGDLFLNGLNLAWGVNPGGKHAFGDDVGPNTGTPNTDYFTSVFEQLEAHGGNAMRLWLHVHGGATPAFNGLTSVVVGPGEGTIDDLKQILDLAWEHEVGMILCLWSFDMQRKSYGTFITERARDLLTDEQFRKAYIDNALVPMVRGLKGHPAIAAWEIFNEPEGMSDEFGWDYVHHVPMTHIQAFVNQCAGAIHRADPQAKVTNGAWSFYSMTDVGAGNTNYYTDARLVAAGGDPDGYLDFYTVHYYDWAGTGRSPFHHPAAHWGLDKPLVVAEFDVGGAHVTSAPYETLFRNGYAGALAWSWTDHNPTSILAQIAALAKAHPKDVRVVRPDPPVGNAAQPEGAFSTTSNP